MPDLFFFFIFASALSGFASRICSIDESSYTAATSLLCSLFLLLSNMSFFSLSEQEWSLCNSFHVTSCPLKHSCIGNGPASCCSPSHTHGTMRVSKIESWDGDEVGWREEGTIEWEEGRGEDGEHVIS